jgi:hypothetical protein
VQRARCDRHRCWALGAARFPRRSRHDRQAQALEVECVRMQMRAAVFYIYSQYIKQQTAHGSLLSSVDWGWNALSRHTRRQSGCAYKAQALAHLIESI